MGVGATAFPASLAPGALMAFHGGAHARLLTLVLALAVWGASAGLPEAMASQLEHGCCKSGLCCCRPGTRGHGTCMRTACRCGGHGAATSATLVPRASLPVARFCLASMPTAGRASSGAVSPDAAGYVVAAFHPPRPLAAC